MRKYFLVVLTIYEAAWKIHGNFGGNFKPWSRTIFEKRLSHQMSIWETEVWLIYHTRFTEFSGFLKKITQHADLQYEKKFLQF